MKYLFYTEGHSEYNFVKSFLWIRGIPFTEDIGQTFTREDHFLHNCKSDSKICSALKSHKKRISEISDGLIVVIADTKSCYTAFKEEYKGHLTSLGISQELKVINSKPELEQIYLEDKNLLKGVIKGYCNQESVKKVASFNELKKSDLLTENCDNRYVTESIVKANNVGWNKDKFSKKFFKQAFKPKSQISIIQRIESIVQI